MSCVSSCCRYTDNGFLVNDVTLQGGLLALRNGFYAWDAAAADLSAVSLLSPPPGPAALYWMSSSCGIA